MDRVTKNFVLQRGRVFHRNHLFFTAYNYEAAMQEIPNGVLFILKDWSEWNGFDVKWSMVSIDICMEPSPMCLVMGRDGEVLIGSKKGFQEERIDDQGFSPLNRGPMQNIRFVEDTAFAVGMGRQVYCRMGFNRWIRFDDGIPTPPPIPEIVGFNSIAGQSLSNLYAVGWKGEIWHYDGKLWTLDDSPTNAILHEILMLADGTLFACGHGGVLLKGTGKQWEIVDHDGPDTNWRTLAWFRDLLYLSDGHNLFCLDGNAIVPVRVDDEGQIPVISLHATNEILLAVTADSAFVTDDGQKWKAVPC